MVENQEIFLQIYNFGNHNSFLNTLMVFGADYIIWITGFLIIFLAVTKSHKERQALLLSILGIIIAMMIIFIIRLFIFEPRPFIALSLTPLINETNSAAFPSLHTTVMAAAFFAYFFTKSKWAPLFLFFLFWVGLARIYVGVHYPFDILGGIITGLVAVLFSIFTVKKLISPNAL